MPGLQPPAVPAFFPGLLGVGGGNGVTQQLNATIRDPFTFLLNRPIYRARRVAAQTIATGHNWVTWDTLDEDTYSGGAINSSIYTVQAPGKYLVCARVSLSGTGASGQQLVPDCAVNGKSPTGQGANGWEGVASQVATGPPANPKAVSSTWEVHANLNDQIQIGFWYSNESGITQTDTTAGWQPAISLVWTGV